MEFQPKDKCRKPGKKQETCFPVRLQCAEIAKQYMEFPNIPNYIMHRCANLRILLKRYRNSIVSDLLLGGGGVKCFNMYVMEIFGECLT